MHLSGRAGGAQSCLSGSAWAGHKLLPSELNFRANIYAMKKLGVERILSVSAVGSLKEEHKPTDFVVPDQFIDRTFHRDRPSSAMALSAMLLLAILYARRWRRLSSQRLRRIGWWAKLGGTYVCMEGPQFSTRAESNLYRSWGADVIGMTNLQEAKLAREAEICYATMAMVTDYDCWHEGHDAVTVEQIVAVLKQNAANAAKVVRAAVAAMPKDAPAPAQRRSVCDSHGSGCDSGRDERKARSVAGQVSGR